MHMVIVDAPTALPIYNNIQSLCLCMKHLELLLLLSLLY